MRRTYSRAPAMLAALLVGVSASARATDGHFLHGVGAINSAMGGVGVAAPSGLLGAFYVNPAGLAALHGTRVELGFEMFKPDRTISSSAGAVRGSTTSSSEFVPIPAFGWSHSLRNDRVVVGVGGLGIGGFGVDYHIDAANPILAPRPYGFGEVYSSFQLMKIAPALAMTVTPKLRVGAALNMDWASLAVDPMPIAAPAVDPGPDGQPNTADDRAYYSRASDADGSFGIGFQAGVQYNVTPMLVVGASYTSPQLFQKFQFGAIYENPNLSSFNSARTIRFAMDMPAVYGVGVAAVDSDWLSLGLDAKYITYAQTRGFDKSGFAADGSVRGFGWDNIWTVAAGLEVRPTERLATRLGYNYSGNPIPDALSMFNAPAPAVVQHHATFGLGYVMPNGLGVDVAYYRAFQNSITGPFQTPAGAMPGTQIKSSMSEQSFLIGFRFAPGARKR
jgi:long-chain fatty acid transport protein